MRASKNENAYPGCRIMLFELSKILRDFMFFDSTDDQICPTVDCFCGPHQLRKTDRTRKHHVFEGWK